MKKRGQITLFLILGIIIVATVGYYYYVKSYSNKQKSQQTIQDTFDPGSVIASYGESCLTSAANEGLFRIGQFGGYINPYGDSEFGEEGIPADNPSTTFNGDKIPYYIVGEWVDFGETKGRLSGFGSCRTKTGRDFIKCLFELFQPSKNLTDPTSGKVTYKTFIPSQEEIKKKLANFIVVQFDKCMKSNSFKDLDMDVYTPSFDLKANNFDFSKTNVNVDISLNAYDVSVDLTYPVTAQRADKKLEVDKFKVTLPISFNTFYYAAQSLVENAQFKQPNKYEINSECGVYDRNGMTNIYLKDSTDGPNEIIQIVDFSTYKNHYLKSYKFQFAVRNLEIEGNCAIQSKPAN